MGKVFTILIMLGLSVFVYGEEGDFKSKLEESGVRMKIALEAGINGKVIAVSEFESEQKDKGILLSDFYASYIDKEKIKIVDRKELSKVIDEVKLEIAGLTQGKSADKLGQLTGADYILTGNMIKIADKVFVNIKVIEISSGITFYSDMISFKDKELQTVSKLEDFFQEKKYPITASFRSAVIPGWGQFYNDQPVKGSIFMGIAAATVGTAIYCSMKDADYENSDAIGEEAAKELKERNKNTDVFNIAVGLAVTDWIVSMVDAYINAK